MNIKEKGSSDNFYIKFLISLFKLLVFKVFSFINFAVLLIILGAVVYIVAHIRYISFTGNDGVLHNYVAYIADDNSAVYTIDIGVSSDNDMSLLNSLLAGYMLSVD